MSKLAAIYRVCGNESTIVQHRLTRPAWFDKRKCWKSFFDSFNVKDINIHVVWDGDKNELFDYISAFPNTTIHEINEKNNQRSLLACYSLASQLQHEMIYFIEDDFLHSPRSGKDMIDGIQHFGLYTLYLHPDRTRHPNDDITLGREILKKTSLGHHISVESTTCSYGIHRQLFNQFKDVLIKHCNEGIGAPNDRGMWRDLITKGYRLFSPVYSISTHCDNPHLADFMDWEKFNNEIII